MTNATRATRGAAQANPSQHHSRNPHSRLLALALKANVGNYLTQLAS